MSKVAATSPRPRRREYEYLGTTSDGVRIIKPPRGRHNLTETQLRKIVEGLIARTGRTRKIEAAE